MNGMNWQRLQYAQKILRTAWRQEYQRVSQNKYKMTVRVFNGQNPANEPLVWRTRAGVSSLEPESGWVNPQTIRAYYMTLTPRNRQALTQLLAHAETEKVQQELADDHAYELSRLANKPLT